MEQWRNGVERHWNEHWDEHWEGRLPACHLIVHIANIIFVIVEGISKFGIKIRNHPGAFKWGNCSPLLPKEGLGVVSYPPLFKNNDLQNVIV